MMKVKQKKLWKIYTDIPTTYYLFEEGDIQYIINILQSNKLIGLRNILTIEQQQVNLIELE